MHIHSHSPDLLVSTDTNLCGSRCLVIEPHSACVCVLCLCFSDQTHVTPLTDPSTLQKNGKHQVNTAQNVPRASVELKENSPEHQMIIEALGPVFEWINQLVLNSISIYVLSTNLFSVERTPS